MRMGEYKLDKCPYCGGEIRLIDGERIFHHKCGKIYICENFPRCNAYVGTYPGTDKPLGRLSNRELRKLKAQAHRDFDILWKSGYISRTSAYKFLSIRLGVPFEETHIGFFDVDLCKRTIQICQDPIFKQLKIFMETVKIIKLADAGKVDDQFADEHCYID